MKSLETQLVSAHREMEMRKRVYPQFILRGKIKPVVAGHEIECMEAIVQTLTELNGQNWLIWSVEHQGFWKSGSLGYTKYADEAGAYSYSDAVGVCKTANAGGAMEECMVPDFRKSRRMG